MQSRWTGAAQWIASIASVVIAVVAWLQVNTTQQEIEQLQQHHARQMEFQSLPFVVFERTISHKLLQEAKGTWRFDLDEAEETVPMLQNYGKGPAIDIKVEWVVEHEKLGISKNSKTIPVQRHLVPGDSAPLAGGPPFFPDRISDLTTGEVEITYRDIHGNYHSVTQEVAVGTYKGRLTVKFGDVTSFPVDWINDSPWDLSHI